MGIFNIYNKAKSHINKTYFTEKHVISFEAYDLLKKFVVKGLTEAKNLDRAYPKNLKITVLKNVSHRSMKTFYKLSDHYKKNKSGMLCQSNDFFLKKKKLSPKARILLKKIKNDLPRYTEIDELFNKYRKSR